MLESILAKQNSRGVSDNNASIDDPKFHVALKSKSTMKIRNHYIILAVSQSLDQKS